MNGAQAALLPGDRLHLHHGPIDLVIGWDGPGRDAAFERAQRRFSDLLEGLVDELARLRRPLDGIAFTGPVARRMARAVTPFSPDHFVTPMAAVAGAVADEVLAAMTSDCPPHRAYVNNGGDVAFALAEGQSLTLAAPSGTLTLPASLPVRGVATSGRGGRSFSLGIADAVTVTARTAAGADAAATLIGNAVDLPGHPAITRERAADLAPDSDLGDRLVTTGVGRLTGGEVQDALRRGLTLAHSFRTRGLIHDAALTLQGQTVTLEKDCLTDA